MSASSQHSKRSTPGPTEAARSLKAATQALKKAQDGVRTGNLRDLKRLLEVADDSAAAYVRALQRAGTRGPSWARTIWPRTSTWTSCASWPRNWVSAVHGSSTAGSTAIRTSSASKPAILPSASAGRSKHVRPSHVAGLQAAQKKPQQGNMEPILNAIEKAYLHLTKGERGPRYR